MSALRFSTDAVRRLLALVPHEARVSLVGDEGVYLMSFDAPMAAPDRRHVVYAHHCNPDVDPDFRAVKRETFGPDDGCEDIGSALDIARLIRGRATLQITFENDDDSITLEAL